jgi:hypothetical protein
VQAMAERFHFFWHLSGEVALLTDVLVQVVKLNAQVCFWSGVVAYCRPFMVGLTGQLKAVVCPV